MRPASSIKAQNREAAAKQRERSPSSSLRQLNVELEGIDVTQLEDFYRKRNILARPILPEDVAEAVLFLASERSAKTTGCTLTFDGGVKDAFPR